MIDIHVIMKRSNYIKNMFWVVFWGKRVILFNLVEIIYKLFNKTSKTICTYKFSIII